MTGELWPARAWEIAPDPRLDPVLDRLRPLPTTSLLVVSGGRVVGQYGRPAEIGYLASARKSVLSVLFGQPVADGVIKLEQSLAELGIDDVGGLLPVERTATVRDLLTARSGVYHPPSTLSGYEVGLPARGSERPGSTFRYNNWDFNALGTVYELCTGRAVFDAVADDLAGPLGFEDFEPGRQRVLGRPERSRHLAHHLFLSGRDLARVGLLAVRGGRWGARAVVPGQWLRESTSVQVDRSAQAPLDYGYLWWLPRLLRPGAFLAAGSFGQYLLGVPELDLVIVHRWTVPDEMVIAQNEGVADQAGPAADGVSVRQFLQVARAVIGALQQPVS